jgi:hypothetical protein
VHHFLDAGTNVTYEPWLIILGLAFLQVFFYRIPEDELENAYPAR